MRKDIINNHSILLYEDDIVYRPPLEVNSVLLEVTHGCTWAKCTFCRSQKPRAFKMHTLYEIEVKLQMLSEIEDYRKNNDLFFLGSNTFALSSARLKPIFEMVHRYLPQIKKISMFSRCDDVTRKSDKEILELKEQRLGNLYIGLESGSDTVLKMCNKGLTSNEMADVFHRLDSLGVGYALSSILGLGGKKYSAEHALNTAALYSRIHPKSIRVMTLTPWPNTQLYEEIARGEFEELSPWEILLEEQLLLREINLNAGNCIFVGTHVSNNIPLAGFLPKHKEAMLAIMDECMATLIPEQVSRSNFIQW